MLPIVYLKVLDTVVTSPRISGANNDSSDYPHLWYTLFLFMGWCMGWSLLRGEREHRVHFSGFFARFWKPCGIFSVSFFGHNVFMPLPPGVE